MSDRTICLFIKNTHDSTCRIYGNGSLVLDERLSVPTNTNFGDERLIGSLGRTTSSNNLLVDVIRKRSLNPPFSIEVADELLSSMYSWFVAKTCALYDVTILLCQGDDNDDDANKGR
jgi:hypothetical protein